MDQQPNISQLSASRIAEARQCFADLGSLRLPGFLSAEAHARLDALDTGKGWSRIRDEARDLELKPLDDAAFAEALARSLQPFGFAPAAAPSLLRHNPGQFGTPPAPSEEACFLIDLNPEWRSEWGGLALFVGEHGRAQGWRPQAGALLLYDAVRPLLLTMVSPGAPTPRLALFGRLRPL